jgi:[acyl-carrier-protein] S-malonyltransferase
MRSSGLDASLSVGMSLGEYNHLVHIGALSFGDAVRLVDARGRAYDRGPAGAMAAVHPATLEELLPLVARVREELGGGEELLDVSNENCSTQQVVAGSREAVDRLVELADDELFARGRIIEERIPMHTARFRPVADALAPSLALAPFAVPDRPYVSNVVGGVVESPSPGTVRELLERHVYERVRLRECVDTVAARAGSPVFVEVGPRRVFHDLVARDHRRAPRFHLDPLDQAATAAETRASILRELGDGA